MIPFESSERYLYEFYHSKEYPRFRKLFVRRLRKHSLIKKEPSKYSLCGEEDKKYLMMEIENVIFYLSHKQIDHLPFLGEVDAETARELNLRPFYLYLRPFAISFLMKVSQKYNIGIYSSFNKELVFFLLGYLEDQQELFQSCISSINPSIPKNVSKFFDQTWTSKNVVFLDFKSEVAANNYRNCVPIHKFKGDPRDSALLFLERYLLNLAESEDVSKIITDDFKVRMSNN